jgi:hypothetical protein
VVPLTVDVQNHLFIKGKVNGKKATMMVDTGSQRTEIDASLVGNLKAVDHLKGKLSGLADDSEAGLPVVVVDKIESGVVTFKPQQMIAGKIRKSSRTQSVTGSNIATSVGSNYEIILGMDLLQANHAVLHVAAQKLYIRKDSPPPALTALIKTKLVASGWVESPLATPSPSDSIFLSAEINGHPVRVLVDTGSFVTLLDSRQRSNLEFGWNGSIGKTAGVGTKQGNLSFTEVNSFKIGDAAELGKINVGVTDLQHVNAVQVLQKLPRIQGILGPEYLHQWIAVIDLSGPSVYLRKKLLAN